MNIIDTGKNDNTYDIYAFEKCLNIVYILGFLSRSDMCGTIVNRYTKLQYSPLLFKYNLKFDGICARCYDNDVVTSPLWNDIYCDSCGLVIAFRLPSRTHITGLNKPGDIKDTIVKRHTRNSIRPVIKRSLIACLMTPDKLWDNIINAIDVLVVMIYGTRIENNISRELRGRFITCKQHISLISRLTSVLTVTGSVDISDDNIIIPDRWLKVCVSHVVNCDVDDHKREFNTIQGCKLANLHHDASYDNSTIEIPELKLRISENDIVEDGDKKILGSDVGSNIDRSPVNMILGNNMDDPHRLLRHDIISRIISGRNDNKTDERKDILEQISSRFSRVEVNPTEPDSNISSNTTPYRYSGGSGFLNIIEHINDSNMNNTTTHEEFNDSTEDITVNTTYVYIDDNVDYGDDTYESD